MRRYVILLDMKKSLIIVVAMIISLIVITTCVASGHKTYSGRVEGYQKSSVIFSIAPGGQKIIHLNIRFSTADLSYSCNIAAGSKHTPIIIKNNGTFKYINIKAGWEETTIIKGTFSNWNKKTRAWRRVEGTYRTNQKNSSGVACQNETYRFSAN